MIDWWFGWHLARTERYKLRHPQAHFFAQPRLDLSDAPGLTDRERYIDNTSWVDEYIGTTRHARRSPFMTHPIWGSISLLRSRRATARWFARS